MTGTSGKYIMTGMMLEWQFIDSLDFANNNQKLQGEIALVSMPRIKEMLVNPDDCPDRSHEKINYSLLGFHDDNGRPMLRMELGGVCQLRCQRCLQGVSYPLKLSSQLRLVERCDWDNFCVEEDEVDGVLVDNQLDVLALLEEEILLSLPFAPIHAVGTCRPVMEGYLVEEADRIKENPFAVLSGLKKK